MTDKSIVTRINQLLAMAWTTNSKARTLAIADQVLELEPDNPEALMIKADNTDNLELKQSLLIRAVKAFDKGELHISDDRDLLLMAINYRLAYACFEMKQFLEALSFCEAALNFATEYKDVDVSLEKDNMKTLYYRILIGLGQWQRILSDTMRDEDKSFAWAYSRLIAAYMITPENKTKNVCANMFWDALMIAPDVPFYMLGYFEEPDDNAEESTVEDFDFALLFYDTLSISDEFYHWYARGVILFGLLSNRFDAREHDYMIDAIDSLGGYEEYEKMSGLVVEGDDQAIIEMLAANKCLAD